MPQAIQATSSPDLESARRLFRKAIRRQLRTSATAFAGADWYLDLDKLANTFVVTILTKKGEVRRFCGARELMFEDEQSGPVGDPDRELSPARQRTSGQIPEEARKASLWALVRRPEADFSRRREALFELCSLDPGEASRFIGQELLRNAANEDWLWTLVFASDEVQFSEQMRQSIGERLLIIARETRESVRAEAEKVVWSAMRRGLSLAQPARAIARPAAIRIVLQGLALDN
jgi:hypothetical protein